MAAKKTVVICCSSAFYKHANELADQLEAKGYKVVVPASAVKMRETGDYDVDRLKTWYKDSSDFHIKVHKAKTHFEEVASGDAILIVNDDKPDNPRYIGPNTTMEWGLAYYLNKPIFILNDVDKSHNAYEEVHSISTAVLDGDLGKIKL